jgi:hypothetical protein
MRQIWTTWKYTLGSFSDTRTKNYDDWVAVIRTCIFVSYMVTNFFIVSGVVRHWNDVPSELYETQEKGLCKTQSNLSKN